MIEDAVELTINTEETQQVTNADFPRNLALMNLSTVCFGSPMTWKIFSCHQASPTLTLRLLFGALVGLLLVVAKALSASQSMILD